MDSFRAMAQLERFSHSHPLTGILKGGFFLRKKPLGGMGSGVQQGENSYTRRSIVLLNNFRGLLWKKLWITSVNSVKNFRIHLLPKGVHF
jgi:hypothetical protein